MKRIRLLRQANWLAREGYAEARITSEKIGWHYARRVRWGPVTFWHPAWYCLLMAGLDLIRRVERMELTPDE